MRASAPALFVVLWSTGFISAKYALPYAEPFTLLSLRLLLVLVLLAPIIYWRRRTCRVDGIKTVGAQGFIGLLIHGCYLGGVFAAIARGMPAGTAALLVSMHPLLTALLSAVWLGESFTAATVVGFLLGAVGVFFILDGGTAAMAGFGGDALICITAALVGMSLGTYWQKKHGSGCDILTASFIQYAAAVAVLLTVAMLTESMEITWSWPLILTLAWLVLALSLAAVFLLLWMIQQGAASRVAALFYLTPGLTVIEAFILFGEALSPLNIAGLLLCSVAVYLIMRRGRGQPLPR